MKDTATEIHPLVLQLPIPDADNSDWAYMSCRQGQRQKHLLVYATHRDFLSAPRCYAILSLNSKHDGMVSCDQYSLGDYAEDNIWSSQLESGIYRLNQQEALPFYLALIGDAALEIACDSIALVDNRYHCASADSALFEYLSTT